MFMFVMTRFERVKRRLRKSLRACFRAVFDNKYELAHRPLRVFARQRCVALSAYHPPERISPEKSGRSLEPLLQIVRIFEFVKRNLVKISLASSVIL